MAPARDCTRFAPSTTGHAHPGTLLAALLCWLDGRSRGARMLLRLEDLDPQRCRAEYASVLVEDLAWLGLEWDQVDLQSARASQHQGALDALERLDLLYPSPDSRVDRDRTGSVALTEARQRRLGPGGWRACGEPLRVRLAPGLRAPRDEGGLELSQWLSSADDPLVRRRDGAVAYQLAVVVDDEACGVNRVVRGHDIASSSALQLALRELLGGREVIYRHHLLLLEQRGRKFAKLHGSVSLRVLRPHYHAPALCGFLASCAGLVPPGTECTPQELLPGFSWQRVRREDVLVRLDGQRLLQDPAVSESA